MMKLLKNKGVRGALLWQLSVAVIACSLCFWFDLRAGLTAAPYAGILHQHLQEVSEDLLPCG